MERQKEKIRKNRRYYFTHMGIKNRTFLYVGLLISLSLMLAVAVFAVGFKQRAILDNSQFTQKRLENVSTHLDSYVDELSAIANETNYNYYLQNYLIEIKDQDEDRLGVKKGGSIQNYEMSTKIFSYALNNRTDVSSIMIFGKKKMLLYKSLYTYRNVLKDYSKYDWYQKAIANPRKTVVTGPQTHEFLEGNTENTLSFGRVISSYEDGSFLGIILIDINLNQIEEICNSSYTEASGSLCILDEDGELVYEMKQGDGSYLFQEEKRLAELKRVVSSSPSAKLISMSNERYQVGVQKMRKTGWSLVSVTKASSITNSINMTILYLLLTGAVLILVVILALNYVLSKVVKPITLLKKSMDEAEESNLKVRVPVTAKDEVGMLAKSYNKMMDRIEILMDQVVEEQEDKRKFELQALQAQINPHFLYNTLDSIIWMAEMKNEKVVPMTEALAKLFRISLNKGNEFIALENELEHVRNYLIIQSMRYLNKFEYEIQMEDGIRKCRTVKLIVQPIVENCIYHGVKMKKAKGHIWIRAFQRENAAVIEIEDNGAGMKKEVCESILDSHAKRENITGSGVGVRNVNERIKLYFGKEYGLQFESEEGEGTKVTILLPIIRE